MPTTCTGEIPPSGRRTLPRGRIHPHAEMDEIDYYSTGDSQSGADDTGDDEFFGEGSLDAERAPEELAQAILLDLQRLVETYGIEGAELEKLVELLKETFTIVECVPRLRDKYSALKEDRDILHDEWLKEKEKYRKRTEVGTQRTCSLSSFPISCYGY